VTRREEGLLERTEMRMLRWILGVSLKDENRNEVKNNRRRIIKIALLTH